MSNRNPDNLPVSDLTDTELASALKKGAKANIWSNTAFEKVERAQETMTEAARRLADRPVDKPKVHSQDGRFLVPISKEELDLIQTAVRRYRDLILSPESAYRSIHGDKWVEREVNKCDEFLDEKSGAENECQSNCPRG